jgi:Na+/proline symporter
MVVGSLASVICSISAVAALGYAFGLPGTYGWGELTRIAIHTAAGLGFLGAGLFTLAWRRSAHPASGCRSGCRCPSS